ncbi:MAG: BTAD domain-containing putative transcriptional regulator, partial [SAR202 cluster bacterium]|nr:BTAD domain-containing putative transcriptional regulator [SAR202 cluster bacterium]
VANPNGRPAWMHSRLLEINGPDSDSKLIDRLLLRCVVDGSEPTNLCLLNTVDSADPRSASRFMQAVEKVSATISSNAGFDEVLTDCFETVLTAARAEGGALLLADSEAQQMVVWHQQNISPDTMQTVSRVIEGTPQFSAATPLQQPLMAIGTCPDDDSAMYLCAPIQAQGRIRGAMLLTTRGLDIPYVIRTMHAVCGQMGAYFQGTSPTRERSGVDSQTKRLPEDARLQVHTLGRLRLILDGQPVPMSRFKRSKALTLLKILVAHRGRPIPRDKLVEMIWPTSDPMLSNRNLRVVLHSLRRTLEPGLTQGGASTLVLNRGDLVLLDPSESVWVDAEDFDQQARQALKHAAQDQVEEAIACYNKASALYQGEYMDDEPYSDWCLFERERLKEVYINLNAQIALTFVGMDDFDQAIEACRTALGVDSGREDIHRALMGLLSQSGRRDEALRQFDLCRWTLSQEIGVPPSPETVAVYQAILDADSSQPAKSSISSTR